MGKKILLVSLAEEQHSNHVGEAIILHSILLSGKGITHNKIGSCIFSEGLLSFTLKCGNLEETSQTNILLGNEYSMEHTLSSQVQRHISIVRTICKYFNCLNS